jgi:hypothetical protein
MPAEYGTTSRTGRTGNFGADRTTGASDTPAPSSEPASSRRRRGEEGAFMSAVAGWVAGGRQGMG